MGSDTKHVIDSHFDTTLERFQQAIVHHKKMEANLHMKVLDYYIMIL